MIRPLFVFAGQSNMMGAAVYPATEQVYYKNSVEYLHKAKRFRKTSGNFKNYGFPSGEFSYKNLAEAYNGLDGSEISSNLNNYTLNTYFCPSMCNLDNVEKRTTKPFDFYSEANAIAGVCVAPFIVKEIEDAGYACAYTHIAKGSVDIDYYINGDAAKYFEQKVLDFFQDAKNRFIQDDTSEKILFWLQGENDGRRGYEYYKKSLYTLWGKCKNLGFTKFFMIRAGFWGEESIVDVMRAQEDFCMECQDAFMLTRVGSFFEYIGQESSLWFNGDLPTEFSHCRDSFYGYPNQHINEKGFKTISKYATPNVIRILFEGKEPILEEERIIHLVR